MLTFQVRYMYQYYLISKNLYFFYLNNLHAHRNLLLSSRFVICNMSKYATEAYMPNVGCTVNTIAEIANLKQEKNHGTPSKYLISYIRTISTWIKNGTYDLKSTYYCHTT